MTEYCANCDTESTYIDDVTVGNGHLEVHKCNNCGGYLGIDATFVEQVQDIVLCPMCDNGTRILLADPSSQ